MRHIAPHRWADARAGLIAPAEVAAMERHAGSCARCAAERERIGDAITAFADIREIEAPELSWDHIGARVYWVTSSERRGRATSERRGRVTSDPSARSSISVSVSAFARTFIQSFRRALSPRRIAVPGLAIAAVLAAWLLIGPRSGDTPSAPALERTADSTSQRADDLTAGDGSGAPARSMARQSGTRAAGQDTSAANRAVISDLISDRGPELRGAVTMLSGAVLLNGQILGFDDIITTGSRLSTGKGEVTIQYDESSGFTVAENSIVTVVRFAPDDVVLEVDGVLVADVTRRDERYRFTVRAGAHDVRVKGTVFRVSHRPGRASKSALEVSCSDGRVVVSRRDGDDPIAVDAGELARFVASGIERRRLPPGDLEQMLRAVPRIPTWTGIDSLRETSSRLDIAPSARNRDESPGTARIGRAARSDQSAGQSTGTIEVDGVAYDHGPFSLRVTPGRHHVKPSNARGTWLEVGAGAVLRPPLPQSRRAAANAPARRAAKRGKDSPRQAEIRRVLDERIRIGACLRSLRKQGVATGDHVTLELGVGKRGELRYLEITDSALPSSAEQCVRDAIDHIAFPAGSLTRLGYRISL